MGGRGGGKRVNLKEAVCPLYKNLTLNSTYLGKSSHKAYRTGSPKRLRSGFSIESTLTNLALKYNFKNPFFAKILYPTIYFRVL